MTRIRVIDLNPPASGTDARDDVVAAIGRTCCCPHCRAPLDGMRLADLRPIETAGWRGVGRKPLTFEATCRVCSRVVVVVVTKDGATVTQHTRSMLDAERVREREQIEARVDPRHRDR